VIAAQTSPAYDDLTVRNALPTRRIRLVLPLAAVLAMGVAGCRVDARARIVIEANRSGSVAIEIGFDGEARVMLDRAGFDVSDPFAGTGLTDDPDVTLSVDRRDGMTYHTASIPIDDVTQPLEAGIEESLVEELSVEFSDNEVTVSGTLAEDPLGIGSTGFAGRTDLIEDVVTASLELVMPGEIVEHNADERDAETLIWDVPVVGEPLTISARSLLPAPTTTTTTTTTTTAATTTTATTTTPTTAAATTAPPTGTAGEAVETPAAGPPGWVLPVATGGVALTAVAVALIPRRRRRHAGSTEPR